MNPGEDPNQALGMSDLAYRKEMSWDQSYNDVYLLDLKTGKPKKVLEHWGSAGTTLSPGGKYLLYFDERSGHWFTHRISMEPRSTSPKSSNVSFQQENDTPEAAGSVRVAGLDGQRSLGPALRPVRHLGNQAGRHGSAHGDRRQGRKQQLVFRYRPLDPEERAIPATQPLLSATTDERTRATGFYRVGLSGAAAPAKVVMLDKAFGAPIRAKNAELFVSTLSRFDEFPDLWVSDTNFSDMQKVSNANPQQSAYVWGKSEIIEYVNADGKSSAPSSQAGRFDPRRSTR